MKKKLLCQMRSDLKKNSLKLKPVIGFVLFAICTIVISAYAPILFGVGSFAGLILYGTNVAEIRGKVGTTIFSKNFYNNFVKQLSIPKNPKSELQTESRGSLKQFSKEWGASLSDSERDTWRSLAAQLPFKNVFAQEYYLTGANLFIKQNCSLKFIGELPISEAPERINMFQDRKFFWNVAADLTPGSESIMCFFNPVMTATEKMVIMSSGIVSPGIKSTPEMKTIKIADSTFVTGDAITADFLAVFGRLPVLGETMFFGYRIINTVSGAQSEQFNKRIIASV